MNFQRLKRIIARVHNVIVDEFKNGVQYADNSALQAELKNKIRLIREINSKKIIMNQLVPQIIKETLEKDNYLISPKQALPYAVNRFNEMFFTGKIDSLYNYTVQTEKERKQQ